MASKKEWKRKYRDEFAAHNDSIKWYSYQVANIDADYGDLRRENDDLRAELTELADEVDCLLRSYEAADEEFETAQRIIRQKDDELDSLRAYATEAYEHGVSDGIDMGREFGLSELADSEYDAGYMTATSYAVSVLESARQRLAGEA